MDFIKAFHIDCGRKYFTKEQLVRIINVMGENGYNTLELAFGNGGMRFLTDDMTVVTKYGKYDSDSVKDAIMSGNRAYCDLGANALTETEMEEIVRTAGERGIKIMPLLNTPGHMDAIVSALEKLGIGNVRYMNSASTIDFDNAEAVEFTGELVRKYVKWFADRGSQFFNMGCDEYANDVLSSGFASLEEASNFKYDKFISYVNSVAEIVIENGLIPVMFNDGMYYNKVTSGGMLDSRIICSYWSEGWWGYNPAPASFVAKCGHRILNTANNWYYVLGRRENSKNPDFNAGASAKGIRKVNKDEVLGHKNCVPMGAMMCLWCDEPDVEYNAEEEQIVTDLIRMF